MSRSIVNPLAFLDSLSPRARKLTYLVTIVLLFIPIVVLGMPAAPAGKGREESRGGQLARLRTANNLGETSLGNVDPASATMNLVLLGFRGIAASVLQKQAMEEQEMKNWPALRATTDSIILLQPHFLKVWDYHGWNLAYNVSAEWDAVADRYYWVKEGIKFTARGAERNEQYPDLYYKTGVILDKKIGRADERKPFRRYFRDADPDEETFKGKPDPALKKVLGREEGNMNLDADNYQVAREWYRRSVRVNQNADKDHQQHIEATALFRAHPTLVLMEYASSLQDEGIFEERLRLAWSDAFEEWTTKFGGEEFNTAERPDLPLQLELTPEHEAELSKTAAGQEAIRWITHYQNMCNYRYWRQHCLAQQERSTRDAHRDLYNGRRKYFESQFGDAVKLLYSGMENLERTQQRYPKLFDDETFKEEAPLGQKFWRAILTLEGDQVPPNYPLKTLWEHSGDWLAKIDDLFNQAGREWELEQRLAAERKKKSGAAENPAP